jgi:hypothetical protein
MTLCHPLLYDLRAAPLKRGRRNPRKGYGRLPRAHMGRHRDDGLVGRISSANSAPMRPSQPPYCRLGHRSAIPSIVGAQDDKTSPHLLLCILRPPISRTLEPTYGRRPNGKLPHDHPRSRSSAGTGLATMPDGSKIHQDDNQLHGIVRHAAIRSLGLCGMIVNLLPLAYKRRGRSPSRGGRMESG